MAHPAPAMPFVSAPSRPALFVVPPAIRFDGLVLTAPGSLARGRSATLAVSLVVHAVLIAALILVPLLWNDVLPASDRALRAFFVSPADMAPPPPPPPPPAAAAGVRRRVKAPAVAGATQPARFTAPIEVPDHVEPEPGHELGVEGGVPGGVDGGVPGGVVGGIVGGLPVEAPPPPTQPVVRIGGRITQPKLLHAVQPAYPGVAAHGRIAGYVVLEAHVGVDGRVKSVRTVAGNPLFTQPAEDAVRQWRYQPLLLNGVPTEFLLTVTVQFRLQPAR